MPIPRTATICARIPEDVKEGLIVVANHFDMSISDVLVRFSRDGLQKFFGANPLVSTYYLEEIKKLK